MDTMDTKIVQELKDLKPDLVDLLAKRIEERERLENSIRSYELQRYKEVLKEHICGYINGVDDIYGGWTLNKDGEVKAVAVLKSFIK